MRYCVACKKMIGPKQTKCPQCGGEVRVVGSTGEPAGSPAPAPAAAADAGYRLAPPKPVPTPKDSSASAPTNFGKPASPKDAQTLTLTLQGLQHQASVGAKRVRKLALMAAGLAVFLALLLVGLQVREVFQYASLTDVKADVGSAGVDAKVEFTPASAGKVEFRRRTPARRETLVQYVVADQPFHFDWSGEESAFAIDVRYRDGWSVKQKTLLNKGSFK